MSLSESSRPDVSLVYVIGRVNQGIRRELRSHLVRWGLSVPEFTALSVLERRPDLSNAQLARRTMVTPQTMIEVLAQLERRGLVERVEDADHGRIRRARLTAQGEQAVLEIRPEVEWMQDQMFSELDADQRQFVLDTMVKAMNQLRPGLAAKPSED